MNDKKIKSLELEYNESKYHIVTSRIFSGEENDIDKKVGSIALIDGDLKICDENLEWITVATKKDIEDLSGKINAENIIVDEDSGLTLSEKFNKIDEDIKSQLNELSSKIEKSFDEKIESIESQIEDIVSSIDAKEVIEKISKLQKDIESLDEKQKNDVRKIVGDTIDKLDTEEIKNLQELTSSISEHDIYISKARELIEEISQNVEKKIDKETYNKDIGDIKKSLGMIKNKIVLENAINYSSLSKLESKKIDGIAYKTIVSEELGELNGDKYEVHLFSGTMGLGVDTAFGLTKNGEFVRSFIRPLSGEKNHIFYYDEALLSYSGGSYSMSNEKVVQGTNHSEVNNKIIIDIFEDRILLTWKVNIDGEEKSRNYFNYGITDVIKEYSFFDDKVNIIKELNKNSSLSDKLSNLESDLSNKISDEVLRLEEQIKDIVSSIDADEVVEKISKIEETISEINKTHKEDIEKIIGVAIEDLEEDNIRTLIDITESVDSNSEEIKNLKDAIKNFVTKDVYNQDIEEIKSLIGAPKSKIRLENQISYSMLDEKDFIEYDGSSFKHIVTEKLGVVDGNVYELHFLSNTFGLAVRNGLALTRNGTRLKDWIKTVSGEKIGSDGYMYYVTGYRMDGYYLSGSSSLPGQGSNNEEVENYLTVDIEEDHVRMTWKSIISGEETIATGFRTVFGDKINKYSFFDGDINIIEKMDKKSTPISEMISDLDNEINEKISSNKEELENKIEDVKSQIKDIVSSIDADEVVEKINVLEKTIKDLEERHDSDIERIAGEALKEITDEEGIEDAFLTLKEITKELKEDEGSVKTILDKISASEKEIEGKVDKEDGKGLSEEDFTSELKTKLDNIEDGANNYKHPNSHSATMITETTDRKFVTQRERELIKTIEELEEKLNKANNTIEELNKKIPFIDEDKGVIVFNSI